MKILIVSWYFPPYSTMGSLRIGKFAKFLIAQGHEVRVISARDEALEKSLPVEVPGEIVNSTNWIDVNGFPAMAQSVRVWLRSLFGSKPSDAKILGDAQPSSTGGNQSAPGADRNAGTPPASARILRKLRRFYQQATNIPDGRIGWLIPAVRAADEVTRDWKPDIVFASAPPFTTLLAGRRIAKRSGAPLVVEFRDRWMEDPYSKVPALRRWIDRILEDWCVRPARQVVTVSEPWAIDYLARWGKPVVVAYNGFDPDDYDELADVVPNSDERLQILYTGILYPERRDPTPLFKALQQMDDVRDQISVRFYGAKIAQLVPIIEAHGLQDIVTVESRVTFKESLRLQRQADVLLLLQWDNVLEEGNVPGKVFEYFAARRPVLGIGYEKGVPARLLRDRNVGLVVNNPDRIAEYLRELLSQKRSAGGIPLLPETGIAGLSRPEQYAGIEDAFASIVKPSP
jgi:glycosyltransferase involved in cell wall biosynthesis